MMHVHLRRQPPQQQSEKQITNTLGSWSSSFASGVSQMNELQGCSSVTMRPASRPSLKPCRLRFAMPLPCRTLIMSSRPRFEKPQGLALDLKTFGPAMYLPLESCTGRPRATLKVFRSGAQCEAARLLSASIWSNFFFPSGVKKSQGYDGILMSSGGWIAIPCAATAWVRGKSAPAKRSPKLGESRSLRMQLPSSWV